MLRYNEIIIIIIIFIKKQGCMLSYLKDRLRHIDFVEKCNHHKRKLRPSFWYQLIWFVIDIL